MTELVLATIVALIIGAGSAWLLRVARERTTTAAVGVQLQSMKEQFAERGKELETARARLEASMAQLRADSAARAAAVEKAARVLSSKQRMPGSTKRSLNPMRNAPRSRLAWRRKATDEKLTLLQEFGQKFSDNFKALSSEASRSNNQSFLELARAALERFQEGARNDLEKRQKAVDDLVKPIRESLEKVDGKLGGEAR